MSYDLMVFAPEEAPRERPAFMAWYERQVEWNDGLDYNDPANATEALREWFMAMTKEFPPMNGPLRSNDLDDAHLSDYAIAKHVIYVAFAWSLAEEAYKTSCELAAKYKVGLFDPSGEGTILTPSHDGLISLGSASGAAVSLSTKKPKWKFW